MPSDRRLLAVAVASDAAWAVGSTGRFPCVSTTRSSVGRGTVGDRSDARRRRKLSPCSGDHFTSQPGQTTGRGLFLFGTLE